MSKSIGKQWLPDWVLLCFLGIVFTCLALLAAVFGGAVWGVTFLLDVRGHVLRFKAWRWERAIMAAYREKTRP